MSAQDDLIADEAFGADRAALDLYDALSTCRAVRRIRPDPIPDAVLTRVLRAAICAPSGGNAQPWRVIAVREHEGKHQLGEVFRKTWAGYSQPGRDAMARLPPEKRARGERTMAAGDQLAANFDDVPVVLVWVHDPRFLGSPEEKSIQPEFIHGGSLYPAIHNLLLACRAEGLGGVITTMAWRYEDEVRALLEIPDPWRMHALVPIGYPVGKGHGQLARKPLEKMVYGERFGDAFPSS